MEKYINKGKYVVIKNHTFTSKGTVIEVFVDPEASVSSCYISNNLFKKCYISDNLSKDNLKIYLSKELFRFGHLKELGLISQKELRKQKIDKINNEKENSNL
jgi:hypothetical protein